MPLRRHAGDLAGHSDQTTAHITAKSIEYPTGQLELASAGRGGPPPVRPPASAALGMALVPVAATRPRRR